jgi:hypothetical protein
VQFSSASGDFTGCACRRHGMLVSTGSMERRGGRVTFFEFPIVVFFYIIVVAFYSIVVHGNFGLVYPID